MKIKQITAVVFLALFLLTGCGRGQEDMAFTEKMGIGFNLGNSLESICTDGSCQGLDLESYWQNPKITQDMLKQIAQAGFGTIRIPVTWDVHMDEDGVIDPAWMERVKEVVQEALDTGMYVILDAHHDTWFMPSGENEASAKEQMKHVWTQIAEAFSECGQNLLFEGMNEPRMIGTDTEWTGESGENDRIVGELNQIFVDTVRAAGGENKERYLLVTPYAGAVESLDHFSLPKGDHLIVTVHAYKPYAFAMEESGTAVWDASEKEQLTDMMHMLQERYTDKGIPVIIGEFGAIDKNNTAEREKWLKDYTTSAKEAGVMYIWWDEGGPGTETYGRYRIFDRQNGEWLFESLKNILLE